MGNPFLDREEKAQQRAGLRSEKQVISKLGGRVHRGSGSSEFLKSDGTVGRFQVEAKSTVKKSIALRRAWLEKIEREALPMGKVPAVSLTFTNDRGDMLTESWVAIPAWALRDLLDAQD